MQESAIELLKLFLFNPASPVELWISGIVAAVAFVMTLNGVGSSLSIPLAQTGRSIAVLVITVAASLAILAFVKHSFSPPGWVLAASAAAIVLVIAVPAVCLLQSGTYPKSLFAMLLSLVAAVVVALTVHAIFGAISKGGDSVGKERKRQSRAEQAIGGK